MRSSIFRTTALSTVSLAAVLGLAACGGSTSSTGAASGTVASAASPSSEAMTSSSPMASEPMSSGAASGGAMTASGQFGSACSAVPTSGMGSFEGMAKDPVATAASHNPVLSTLAAAVTKANLGDTLNGAKDITVFAPTNDAFAAMDKATLDKAMGDPTGLLTTVLTNHVVPGRLTPAQLAGTHKTLGGGSVMVSGSGESFVVDGTAAVVCGNVQTANATVYIIDKVLLPKS